MRNHIIAVYEIKKIQRFLLQVFSYDSMWNINTIHEMLIQLETI